MPGRSSPTKGDHFSRYRQRCTSVLKSIAVSGLLAYCLIGRQKIGQDRQYDRQESGIDEELSKLDNKSRLAREPFRPGLPWTDHEQNLIQAHGGGVLFHEGIFYWFGEDKGGQTYTRASKAYAPPRVDVLGVNCYSSTDLLHWYFEGVALKGGSHPDLQASNVLERPKVLHHRRTDRFVMWMHIDTGDYEWARAGVAVADEITGPYRFIKSFRPFNQESRDCTVFQDTDGTAFLVYASEDNHAIHMAKLTEDYLSLELHYNRLMVNLEREAPAVFKFKDYYLLLTSACTGWEPNRAEVFYARDMMGEWTSLGNPAAGGDSMDRAYSFFSQTTHVLPLPGHADRFIYMADQWNTDDLGASRYVWLPMWVEEIPAAELAEDHKRWQSFTLIDKAMGRELPLQPGPLRVIIAWQSGWFLSTLREPLDARIKHEYIAERRIDD